MAMKGGGGDAQGQRLEHRIIDAFVVPEFYSSSHQGKNKHHSEPPEKTMPDKCSFNFL